VPLTEIPQLFAALPILIGISFVAWLISLKTGKVSVIDTFWPLLVTAALWVYLIQYPGENQVNWIAVTLVCLWGGRLFLHIFLRARGQCEDRRYTELRSRWKSNFEMKSLVGIFGLQAFMAWIVSFSLFFALRGESEFSPLRWTAAGIWLFGITFETVADVQLRAFQRAKNRNGVLDTGLWRYSRHPNYFGECCVWWGAYLMALPADGWWSIASPLLMTYCLLDFTGIRRMEFGVVQRRPDYDAYTQKTSRLIPLPPRK